MSTQPRKRFVSLALILAGLLMAIALFAIGNGVKKAIEPNISRLGVSRVHVASPSSGEGWPDDRWIAAMSEYWDNDERQRTLTLFSMPHSNSTFSLTPEYLEVIEGPDPSVIAYITRDSANWYSVFTFDPKGREARDVRTGKIVRVTLPFPHKKVSTSNIKKSLQFSSDGKYITYMMRRANAVSGPSKRVYSDMETGSWGDVDSMKARGVDVEKLEWLPAKKPKKMPAFMTDKTPRIHEETVPVWSPDAKHLFVHDDKGIWMVNALPQRMQIWKLYLPMENLRAFQLSKDGRYFLVETDSKEAGYRKIDELDARGEPIWYNGVERNIAVVDLESKEKRPKPVGEGWGAVWSNQSDQFAYWSSDGLHIARPGGEMRHIDTRGPDGKVMDVRDRVSYNRMSTWSPDDSKIYARDQGGIWRFNLQTPGAVWENPCPWLFIHNLWSYSLSPDGRYLLVETDRTALTDGFSAIERPGGGTDDAYRPTYGAFLKRKDDVRLPKMIVLIDLEGGKGSARYVGDGWGAMFDSTSDGFFFANFLGVYRGRVDDGKAMWMGITTVNTY